MITPFRTTTYDGRTPHRVHRCRRRTAPPTVFSGTIFRLCPRLEVMEDRTLLSTFLVSNTGDSGPGSLRQAIIDSNAAIGTTNTIDFDIAGSGVQTIAPLSPLPTITNAVVIDGYSQPGASPNTDAESDNAVLQIVLDGTTAGYDIDGLAIAATAVSIRGLVIDNFFGYGIHLLDSSGQDVIAGNFIGVDASGNSAKYNYYAGILVDNVSLNTIGGTTPADRNIISGNYYEGVELDGALSSGNEVVGNFIGTDASGAAPPANSFGYGSGVALFDGATGNLIGGTSPGAGNVISANGAGVVISGTSNLIQGNLIGTDATGTVALGNNGAGVDLYGLDVDSGSSGNTVGGTVAGAGNLIANNVGSGIAVAGDNSVGDLISGNRVFANGGPAIDLGTDGATNAPAPRQGPNDLQNFPVVVKTADGQLEGWLGGSTPNTLFHIEIFASAGFSASGLGEAEAYLGSLAVTTDGQGQAVFVVPFALPADKPVVTATATDPDGNTSEVSALRQATLVAPGQSVRVVPGQPLIFSTEPGDGVALDDSDTGPLSPAWDLTFSVSSGTLTLSSTAGLTGSGDGTGSLSYIGSASALDAALAGLLFTPPPQAHVFATASLDAQSYGAPAFQAQFTLTDGVFVVTTPADSGPGSLRQAILDSNSVTGGTRTIGFAIPGQGIQVIALASSLPTISDEVLIDGWSQPGFAGAPLIALTSQPPGSFDILSTDSASLTVRGLAIHGLAGDNLDSYRIDTTTDERLVAQVHAEGTTTLLLLVDAQGHLLTESDGQSSSNPDGLIDVHVPAGSVYLDVATVGGAGTYTLTTSLTPSIAPFQPIPVAPVTIEGSGSVSFVAGDFTGDGKTDLAIPESNDIAVLLGNGDGTFQPAVRYAVAGPGLIVSGDFNDDGRLDLAFASTAYPSGAVSVLLGNGDGTFQAPTTVATRVFAGSLVTSDFNRDGRLDIAVSDSDGVQILLGNGDGTFQPAETVAAGIGGAMVAGDFTGDGKLDLAVTDEGMDMVGSGGVSVLLGNGDGTFQAPTTYAAGAGPMFVVAGDFTGNGKLDLAVANLVSQDVSVLLGNGDGTFQPQQRFAVGADPLGLTAGDFTGNGRLDLAVATYSGVEELLANGDGSFQPAVLVSSGNEAQAVVAADFNGDGRLDLATINPNGVSVLLGNGDGTFQTQQQQLATGNGPWSLIAGDFTGDGRLDLATANSGSNTVSILLGNGDGTFQPQQQFAAGQYPIFLAAGDFNGDGRLDLAVVNSGGTYYSVVVPGNVSVLLGNGDGTFQAPMQFAPGEFQLPNALVTGDFNGDGRLDLAVLDGGNESYGGTDPSTVSVLLGNGDGTFKPPLRFASGLLLAEGLVAGDFNGDGRTDLAVVGYNVDPLTSASLGEVSVFLGHGTGTFQPGQEISVPGDSESVVAGDFTGDGRLDLVVTEFSGGAFVLLGNGDGTFQTPKTFVLGFSPGSQVASDFNGDGLLDLATANSASNDISVLLANGDGSFVYPSQFATPPHATPLVTDVNGDGTDDVLVVDGAGNILYRQGIPGQPGAFAPPVTINAGFPSRDIVWAPNTIDGPLLASVDAQNNAVSLYAYRDGGFVRIGSVTTGQLPAQIIAADLTGTGWDDLVVRNAGDGTLSVFFAKTLTGPVNLHDEIQAFLPPVTLAVGLGVSDVQAVDTTGSSMLSLVVTNALTAQVSVLSNLGKETFAPPVPYRAGTGLSEIDPGSTPEVASPEATTGVAAGPFTPGSPTDLVTINPGSNTMDMLPGLGGGRFANPVAINTESPAQVVRASDLTSNGLEDLAVLTTSGVSIYLGNGKGGFLPPVTYDVPPESSGLTVADVNHDGKLDLLVGDADGDVLVLLGNGNGTFAPYHEANQAVELAVTDLTGNGSKDIIYADQGLDRVVVDYGAGNSSVLANQSTGLLEPGAVALADLNGDGIPDLIVANSGSNNVLIYPGLGNGQFGPAINDGNGYFVGTNPVGITVANLAGALPDLVVADQGSDQVSILLNQSQIGSAISFSAGPRLNSGGSGPVSTVVGNFTGGAFPDLLVTNNQSNDVTLLQGVGQGFFNDTNPRTYSVGTDPGATFVGNFNGQTDLVTVNAGSNDLTLISNFDGPDPVTSTIASGGVDPDAAFAFADGSGFEDLVVGNAGDGELALFEGGADGLGLAAATSEANLPDPTALAFSALTGGQVQFYAATAGHESAELVALSLGIETGLSSSADASFAASSLAQLVPLSDSSLPLVATVLTLTITVSGDEFNLAQAETEAAFLSGTGATVGQGLSSQARGGPGGDDGTVSDESQAGVAGSVPAVIAPWQRFVIGLDKALEQFWRDNPNGVSGAPARDAAGDPPASPTPSVVAPAHGGPTSLKSGSSPVQSGDVPDRTENSSKRLGVEAIDAAAAALWGEDAPLDVRVNAAFSEPCPFTARTEPRPPRVGRTAPIVVAPENDRPNLASTSLLVAVLAARWRLGRRAKEPAKPMLELRSHGCFDRSRRAKLRPCRLGEPGGSGRVVCVPSPPRGEGGRRPGEGASAEIAHRI